MIKNNPKDFSLNSGERQTGVNLGEIRLDHRLRYEFAAQLLKKEEKNINQCLDIFCGNGYGTFMMAKEFPNKTFRAIDGSQEAITAAKNNYSLKNISFLSRIFPFNLENGFYEMIVCFESLEHIENDQLLIEIISNSLKENGFLLISVPNDNIISLRKNPHPFHFRHYKHDEIVALLQKSFEIMDWYGQNTYHLNQNGLNSFELLPDCEMNLRHNVEGQVNLYLAQKNK